MKNAEIRSCYCQYTCASFHTRNIPYQFTPKTTTALFIYACTPCSHNVRILQKQLSGTASWFSGESLSRNPFDVRTNENTVAASTTPPETAHGKTEMVFGLPHHTRPRQGHIEQQRASRRVVRPPPCAAACFNLQRGRSYGREIHHYENTEKRVLVRSTFYGTNGSYSFYDRTHVAYGRRYRHRAGTT